MADILNVLQTMWFEEDDLTDCAVTCGPVYFSDKKPSTRHHKEQGILELVLRIQPFLSVSSGFRLDYWTHIRVDAKYFMSDSILLDQIKTHVYIFTYYLFFL